MAFGSLLLAVLASIGVLLALVPLLGWINWLALPLAVTGLILGSIAANSNAQHKRSSCTAQLAILMNCVALGVGILRLLLGGGVV
jgi:hypothetical protein